MRAALPRNPRLWYHGPMHDPWPPHLPRRPLVWPLILAALLGLTAVALLSGRLAQVPSLRWAIDDPALPADGFYASETGPDGVPFRWSRPSAGFLVPALAARQVVTLELATPRTAGQPLPSGLALGSQRCTPPSTGQPGLGHGGGDGS